MTFLLKFVEPDQATEGDNFIDSAIGLEVNEAQISRMQMYHLGLLRQ